MKLIIGLGNPGKQYENTRHNAGAIVLDELKRHLGFPVFELIGKFNALISEHGSGEEKTLLVKPQSYMNRSGEVLKKIIDFYKIPIENIIVLHDDLDIDLGSFKVSIDSSAAGHNGVQSIFDNLGTQKIKRVRIGIEGAEKKKNRIIAGDVFVLQNFSEEEFRTIKELSQKIAEEI